MCKNESIKGLWALCLSSDSRSLKCWDSETDTIKTLSMVDVIDGKYFKVLKNFSVFKRGKTLMYWWDNVQHPAKSKNQLLYIIDSQTVCVYNYEDNVQFLLKKPFDLNNAKCLVGTIPNSLKKSKDDMFIYSSDNIMLYKDLQMNSNRVLLYCSYKDIPNLFCNLDLNEGKHLVEKQHILWDYLKDVSPRRLKLYNIVTPFGSNEFMFIFLVDSRFAADCNTREELCNKLDKVYENWSENEKMTDFCDDMQTLIMT